MEIKLKYEPIYVTGTSKKNIVEKITIEIDSLKTYRRALINEAVTGKLNIE